MTYIPGNACPKEQDRKEPVLKVVDSLPPEVAYWDITQEVSDVALPMLQESLGQAITDTAESPNPADRLFTQSPDVDPDERLMWKDFGFDFSERVMLGTDALPTNPEARVRHVVNAIKNVAPTAIQSNDGLKPLEALDRMNKRLATPNKIEGKEVPKEDTLPSSTLHEAMMEPLAYLNDPVYQALMQLRKQYSRRLQPAEWSQLCRDVLLSSKQAVIEKVYTEYIARYKAALPTAKKIGDLLSTMRILY